MPYARRNFSRAPMRRRQRRWQWIRDNRNSVTPIVEPAFATVDLLNIFRVNVGVDLNFPEFTIWRVRIKVSVRFTPTLTAANIDSNCGVVVAMFVDDMSDVGNNPNVSSYHEKYLLWDSMYIYKTLSNAGGTTAFASTEDIALYQEYDMKGRRKLGNIGDSLLFQLAPIHGTIVNYSLTQQTLVLMGH